MNSETDNQTCLFQDTSESSNTNWMGLVMDHRRLFDALQDGWLRPLSQGMGILVGVGAYAVEHCATASTHPIFVRIKLEPAKLPVLDIALYRQGDWTSARLADLVSTDKTVYWTGALPTFAFSEFLVSTEEERAHLAGMAGQSSNVSLPRGLVRVGQPSGEDIKSEVSLPQVTSRLVVAPGEDAIRGAMTMAVRAFPRIGPWVDVLVAGLSLDRKRLPERAGAVGAGWWRFPPWMTSSDTQPSCFQESLWLAAIRVFRAASMEGRIGSHALAERIAAAMPRSDSAVDGRQTLSWLDSTIGILRASSTIRFDDWNQRPVEIAIQLVLTRPDPIRFMTWFKDRPDLAPAIGWSAAALCGLLHGYRRLDTQFRGGALQQEILAIHALRTCAVDGGDVVWPQQSPSAEPRWRRESGEIVLSWGDRDFARRPESVRGRWHTANFNDEKVERTALEVAKKMNWPCLVRELRWKDVQIPFSGPGTVQVALTPAPQRRLNVEGEVKVRLPEGIVVEEGLDPESFRHLVAVEEVRLPEPPIPETKLDAIRIEPLDVPGLTYERDFLSEDEEKVLVMEIDRSDWKYDLSRRVQHYGWRYAYKERKVDPDNDYLGSLPKWSDSIVDRLVSSELVPQRPDQLIVNEYVEKQGISAHSDSKSFADGIATISLLESWEMVFREKTSGSTRRVVKWLERRSVAVMRGPSRSRWTHEIPPKLYLYEPGPDGKPKRTRKKRVRRISLTFRKVITPTGGGRKHD